MLLIIFCIIFLFNQAKIIPIEDPKYIEGCKFNHVWNIIKDLEKFKDGGASSRKVPNQYDLRYISSKLENPTHDSAAQVSICLSSYYLNLDGDEDNIGESPSQRPMGVKKSKMKRKIDDKTLASGAIKDDKYSKKILFRDSKYELCLKK